MLTSCCKIFSRSANIFLKLNCNKFRLLSRNFYQSQAYQLQSPFNRQSRSNDFYDNYNKKLRETNCSFEGLLKRIEEDENFLKTSISSALNIIFAYAITKTKLPEHIRSKELYQISKSKEFITFFAVVQDQLSELTLTDLVLLFRLLSLLNVPFDSIRFEDATRRLIENQRSLTFLERSSLYQTLYNCGNSRMMAESEKLEKYLVRDLEMQAYVESARSALLAVQLVQDNFVPDDVRAQVLEDIVGLSSWNTTIMFKLFLPALTNLPSTHPKYTYIKNLYFEKIKTHCYNNGRFADHFLVSYGTMVRRKGIEYCDKLIDELVHKSMQFTRNSFSMEKVGLALQLSNHVNYEYLEYASNLIQSNSSLLIENQNLFVKIIDLLSDSNHDHEKRSRWSGILPFIRDSPALLNTIRIYEKGRAKLSDYITLVVRLASLGIYNDGSLRFLSRHINTRPDIVTELGYSGYFFTFAVGLLNESVRVLHPGFSENFLNDNALSFFNNERYEFKFMPSPNQVFMLDMQGCLDSVSKTENSIMLQCLTKGGLSIDGLVAINDKGELYSFTAFEKEDIIFLEDIIVPKNFELISLSFVTNNRYSRNTHSLSYWVSQRLKVLEAMGYPSIYILQGTWDELDHKDRGKYLFDLIYKKRMNEMLSAPSGIPLEPVDPTV